MLKKKIIMILNFTLLLQLSLQADGNEKIEREFLPKNIESIGSFFCLDNYVILDEQLVLDDRSLSVAVHYMDEDNLIFDRAIIYEESADGLIVHLVVDSFLIMNRPDGVIVDISGTQDFYGFTINYAYPTDPIYETGIELRGYFNEGRSPADPPIGIDWNTEEKYFHEFVLNWDEL